MRLAIITISDRASEGLYEDESGNIIEKILRENLENSSVERDIVPDEENLILQKLEKYSNDVEIIITTGGTGISPRDITPDVCKKYCEKEIPGIAEMLRYESYKETPFAVLSRSFAGLKDKTLIINLPGSPKAALLCTKSLLPIMQHAIDMANDKNHKHN